MQTISALYKFIVRISVMPKVNIQMKQLAKHRLSELLQGRLIDNIDFTAFISKV